MDKKQDKVKRKVLMLASVASMIDQFNLPNIRLMQELGYEVHVACNFKKGNTCDKEQLIKLRRLLRSMHVTYHQWDCPRTDIFVIHYYKAYLQLRKLIKNCPFAWIHCHSPIGGMLGRIVAHQKNIPVIYTAHGFHFYLGASIKNWMFYYPVEKLLAYWTDVLITINQEDYNFAKHNLRAKLIHYIPGIGIDTNRYQQFYPKNLNAYKNRDFRNENKLPEEAVILLSVGELSFRKNHQLVVSAMVELKKKNVFYMICGQGKCKEMLLEQAKKIGVADRIRLLGFQDSLEEIYCNADIFVFPSLQEGMPVALMEAMAAGLPCVVSDIRGNRELIDDKLLFQPYQKEQLIRIINILLENAQLRREYGRKNQQKVKGYDLKIVESKMRHIYMHFDNKLL